MSNIFPFYTVLEIIHLGCTRTIEDYECMENCLGNNFQRIYEL